MSAPAAQRQVITLALAQALFQTVSALVMTVGALAGSRIAASPEWATFPIATMFLGTAVATFPASQWMTRVGRRKGFILGALLGTAGGLVGALGIALGTLWVLAAGTFLVGSYQAFAQFYRFAASEVADAAFRPRAISLVLGGGIVAAFLGPLLGRLGGPLLEPAFVGSFLIVACVSLLGAGAVLPLQMPAAAQDSADRGQGRRWVDIVRQPAYLVALSGAATGYGVMILGMTATPLAMSHHHHDLPATSTVIQLHVLGMFLPSFFTGALIARHGELRVMLAGVAVLAGHVVLAASGTGFTAFAGALTLLGIGWNFLYIGGTTLLTRTYRPEEKGRAQATNDMTLFVVGLLCSFSAGWAQQALGWRLLNMLLLPWLGATALALIAYAVLRRRKAGGPAGIAQPDSTG